MVYYKTEYYENGKIKSVEISGIFLSIKGKLSIDHSNEE